MPFSDEKSDKINPRLKLLEMINRLSEDQLQIVLSKIEELPFKENRKQLRKRCPLKIDFTVKDNQVKGCIHDISYSGVFIETDLPFSIGSGVAIEFSIKGLNDPMKILGEIVRKTSRGIGVSFKNLSEVQEQIIEAFVDSH